MKIDISIDIDHQIDYSAESYLKLLVSLPPLKKRSETKNKRSKLPVSGRTHRRTDEFIQL